MVALGGEAWRLLAALAALVTLTAIFVLPGFALARLWRRGPWAPSDLLAATAGSVLLNAALAGPLMAAHLWTRPVAGGVQLLLAALGAPGAWSWARATFGRSPRLRWGLGWVLLLSLPHLQVATESQVHGRPSFPWYYWNLATQLGEAGGVPPATLEYGMALRWLPDYVLFHGVTVAYSAWMAPFGDLRAILAWPWPVAVFALGATAGVLRLWVPRLAAWIGAPVVVATVLMGSKLNAYKPEGIAAVLGLVAVALLVQGLRRRELARVLLAGALIGLDLAYHVIAATALALMLVAAGLAELVAGARRRGWTLGALAAGAGAALVAMVAVGLGLQGRATVAGDAMHPKIVGGRDPTWVFLQLDRGKGLALARGRPDFDAQVDRAIDTFFTPWPKVNLLDWPYGYVLLVILCGLALAAWLGTGRARRGVATVLVHGALLAGVMVTFALAFDTHVPRHTGLARFARYGSFTWGMAAALSLHGWTRLARALGRPRCASRDQAARVALAVALLGFSGATWGARRPRSAVRGAGLQAWSWLRAHALPGDVVLHNVHTSGSMEFFTGLEAPLEGRQPLIEPYPILRGAIEMLEGAYGYFGSGGRTVEFLRQTHARWVLVADKPATFGENRGFGGGLASLRRASGLELVWERPGVAIFRVRLDPDEPPALDPGSGPSAGGAGPHGG